MSIFHDAKGPVPVIGSALALDAAWMTIVISVLIEVLHGTEHMPETYTWSAGWWALLLVASSSLGLLLLRLTGNPEGQLSRMQVFLLGVPLIAPAAWLGWTTIYTLTTPDWWMYPSLRIFASSAVSLVLLMYLINRTADLRTSSLDRSFAYARFSRATTFVAGAGIVLGLGVRYGDSSASVLPAAWLLVYLLAGLLLLALTPERLRAGSSGQTQASVRDRVAYSVIAALVVAVAGILLAVLVSPEIMALLGRGLSMVWSLVRGAILLIALPLGLLVQLLVWLVRLVLNPTEPPEQPDMAQTAEEMLKQGEVVTGGPVWLGVALRVMTVLMLLFVAYYLYRQLRAAREQRSNIPETGDVHESTGGLLDWFNRKFGSKQAADEVTTSAPTRDESAEVRRVREAFRLFLNNAAKYYRPIQRSETARYYQNRLATNLDSTEQFGLSRLLSVYETARYGRKATVEDAAYSEEAANRFAKWVSEELVEDLAEDEVRED